MKLVSIISTWADTVCLLPFCIKNHLEFCDNVIVIWSQYSNHGVKNDAVLEYILANGHDSRVQFVQCEPWRGVTPLNSETKKRNHGIAAAREGGFTHVLVSDADEMWNPIEMNKEKEKFNNEALYGIVHPLRVYIKSPLLWCEDWTLVPGIQRMRKDLCVGHFKEYPFAYNEAGVPRIDPSRRPNFIQGIQYSETPMHHYSYVRKNIDLKIDNSSANLKRSRQVIYEELRDAKPGYLSRLYHQPLHETENYFNLPTW
jgi:hypothetical protein